MKKIFTFLFIALFKLSTAQSYSQGDIAVDFQISLVHDDNSCVSFPSFSFFMITINNSHVGDTVLVKDFFSNSLISLEINNSGQNPWIINLQPEYMGFQFIPDFNLNSSGDYALSTILYKIKNDNDSINDAYGIGFIHVDNPCIYSTVSGTSYSDINSNCIYDGNDGTFFNLMVNTEASYNINGNYPNQTVFNNGFTPFGIYTTYVQQSFLSSCTVSFNNSMLPFAYPNSCTPGIYNFTTLPQTNVDFALQCSSNIDVSVFAGASSQIRPGIPFMLYPHVGNMGCDTVSGWLKLVLDNRVTYNSVLSTLPPNLINGDTLVWNYVPISNISNSGFWNSLTASLHLTPDTTVNIGDTLCFYIYSNLPSADINPSNNQNTICLPVVNSYDPNEKHVSPKGLGITGIIPPSQEFLTYTVFFQNTGNASAINVKVVDTLDTNILPQSLEILGRSHSMTPQWLAPGVVRFNFNNINLPDSNSNETASHGFLTFRVKTNGSLPLGTQIQNKANIYFDFNAPIITNTTLNTVDIVTGDFAISKNKNLIISPNPAKEIVTLKNLNYKHGTISCLEVYNLSGIKILEQKLNSTNSTINISEFSKGIYIFKLVCEGEVSVAKVAVE